MTLFGWLALALVLAAAAVDLRTRRVPNVLVAPAFAFALLAQGAPLEALGAAAVAALPLMALAVLAPAAMGMGDVKLAAAAGALVGPAALGELLLAVALLGGALALLALLRRASTLAYGPAIAGGAALVVLL